MPSDRTTVTELGTALGMLGAPDIESAIRSRTPAMRSLSPETWDRLAQLRAGGAYDGEFHAAWENGRAFLAADDGLRGRLPHVLEWKGTGRAPGDEVAPIDLRVDHVYLVSCKYLSKILFNVSPSHVFDDLLVGAHARAVRSGGNGGGGRDWFAEVALAEYQALYEAVRAAASVQDNGRLERRLDSPVGNPAPARDRSSPGATTFPGLGSDIEATLVTADRPADTPTPAPASLRALPPRAVDLTTQQRDALGVWLRRGWPDNAKLLYARLSDAVAAASARRWESALGLAGGRGESMLWRLLRMGSAPYFVLGSSDERSLRLRIATSWDWRQQFTLLSLTVEAQPGGQARVGWVARIRARASHEVHEVGGHIEVRWSHGRFGGLPEAKGYLDTPHHLVPGYYSLR